MISKGFGNDTCSRPGRRLHTPFRTTPQLSAFLLCSGRLGLTHPRVRSPRAPGGNTGWPQSASVCLSREWRAALTLTVESDRTPLRSAPYSTALCPGCGPRSLYTRRPGAGPRAPRGDLGVVVPASSAARGRSDSGDRGSCPGF